MGKASGRKQRREGEKRLILASQKTVAGWIGNIAVILLLIIFFPLGIGAYKRNSVWNNEVTLWGDVVRKSADKARGYNNLGLAYGELDRV